MANQKPKASTQQHLDIDDITQDLVLLKSGNVALIMSTTAVNFDILSEAEQDATIYAYGALLNSLSFPVETLIRSKKADISSYFQHLTKALESQPNPDLRNQIQKYMDFIQATVQQKTVLDKKFYLVITFSLLELGLKSMKKQSNKTKNKAQLISDAKISLMPKRDHLIKQTSRLGLTTKQLTTKELIELFYDIYNPAPTGTQKISLDSGSYTNPIVQPDLETPAPAPSQSGTGSAPLSNADGTFDVPPPQSYAVGKSDLLQPNTVGPPGVPSTLYDPGQSVPAGSPVAPSIPSMNNPYAPTSIASELQIPITPPQNAPSEQQEEALKNLQTATANAAQFTKGPPLPSPALNSQNPLEVKS